MASSAVRLWSEQEEPLVRFLLGTLPPAEAEAIEDRLFDDPELLDEVAAAGDDLIHAYLTASLSDEDKQRFESHFLASPIRRRRFEFIRGLIAATRETTPAPAARWVTWAAAAALVLALGGLGALLWPTHPVEVPIAHEVEPPPTPPTPAPTATAARPSVTAQVVRVPAAMTRPIDVVLSKETRTLRLEVALAEDRYPGYDVDLRDASGTRVWEARSRVASGPRGSLVLEVPARLLAGARYVLHVAGERMRDDSGEAPWAIQYRLRITRAEELPPRPSP